MKTSFGEFRVASLRETVTGFKADTPAGVYEYYQQHIATSPNWNPDVENMVVILMSVRATIKGHSVVSTGILDQVLVHPREIFRTAIVGNAHGIVLLHNHPSGDPVPSDPDCRVTRDVEAASRVVRISLYDHIIVGRKTDTCRGYCSLRELGLMNRL